MTAMQRRRVGWRGLCTTAGTALLLAVSAAVPADAQVFDVLTIDPEEGPAGTVVTGTVDQAAIPASCSMTPEDFAAEGQAEFDDVNNAFIAFAEETWGGVANRPDPSTDAQSFAADLFTGVFAGALFLPDTTAQAWRQTFVLTFADIATQQPVGELSSFDPETGVGEVTTPEVDPGTWAVAATCLHWNTEATVGDVTDAMAIATSFVEDNLTAPYPALGSPEFIELAQQIGPDLLGNRFLLPGELWVSLYCVHDADGECPDDGPGLGPGPGPTPEPPATPPPATPVVGAPDLTG